MMSPHQQTTGVLRRGWNHEGQELRLLDKHSVSLLSQDETTASMSDDDKASDSFDVDDHEESSLFMIDSNNTKPRTPTRPSLGRFLQLLMGIVGIYGAFLSYGMAQEKIYSYKSPVDGASFRYVWFLQVVESSSSIGLGLIGRRLFGSRRDLRIRPFLSTGASQVFAKVFMSLSLLSGASFPIVTLAKSAKIVPVMIGQFLLGGSTFMFRDVVFAVCLVMGTVLLSYGNTRPDSDRDDDRDTFMGGVFILLSLFMDGCTGGLQQKLKKDTQATPPTTFDYVYYSHVSMLLVALVVSFVTGDLGNGIVCVVQHPDILWRVSKLCFLSVLGQVVVFYVISTFDPLVCATITTTRKMCSVLLSIGKCIHALGGAIVLTILLVEGFRGYHLSPMGYSGLALALAGLGLEVHGKVTASCQSFQNNKKDMQELV